MIYVYSRRNDYWFFQMFQGLCLFQGLRLFQSLEYTLVIIMRNLKKRQKSFIESMNEDLHTWRLFSKYMDWFLTWNELKRDIRKSGQSWIGEIGNSTNLPLCAGSKCVTILHANTGCTQYWGYTALELRGKIGEDRTFEIFTR